SCRPALFGRPGTDRVYLQREPTVPEPREDRLTKVPSLKGVWYRGMFPHDGSCATLEDWFDPNRLKDDAIYRFFGLESVNCLDFQFFPISIEYSTKYPALTGHRALLEIAHAKVFAESGKPRRACVEITAIH